MSTIYNWVICQMDTKVKEEELTDVVIVVHWRRTATLIKEDKIYNAEIYGSMDCITPSETDFTAYSDLTFQQIYQWLEEGLNVSELDANLDLQIENMINPPIVILPLPFALPKNEILSEIIEEKEVILEPKTI